MNEPILPRPMDELGELATLVRTSFADAFASAKGSLWTSFGSPDVHTLARWLQSVAPTNEERVAAWQATLNNFFADPWCRAHHFPISHLCRHVHKYHQPLQRKPVSLDELKQERLRQLLEAPSDELGKARCIELTRQIRELEEQVEREARHARRR